MLTPDDVCKAIIGAAEHNIETITADMNREKENNNLLMEMYNRGAADALKSMVAGIKALRTSIVPTNKEVSHGQAPG